MNKPTPKPKAWTLKTQFYDDSDPKARTSIKELLNFRKIGSIYNDLPVSKYPRDPKTNEVIGIKLRNKSQSVSMAEAELVTADIVTAELVVTPEIVITNDEVSDDILECSSMPIRGRGRPKKPINRDATILKLYELRATSKKANDEIAECFEDLMDHRTNTPMKKKDIPEWLRIDVWETQFDNRLEAKCPCCSRRDISKESFSAGHIVPESCGGDMSLNNLMAICKECNTRMGTHHLYWFAWRYYSKVFWQV